MIILIIIGLNYYLDAIQFIGNALSSTSICCRKVPFFGIYVVMFIDVSYTFMKVSVVVLLFIFAFSLGFFVLLSNQQYFSNLVFAIIKTLIMTSGEMEYDNLFFDNQYNYENLTTVPYMNTTKALFVMFVITMPIIIMNLLVGLAVDDIKLVQENAVLKRIAMQVRNEYFKLSRFMYTEFQRSSSS